MKKYILKWIIDPSGAEINPMDRDETKLFNTWNEAAQIGQLFNQPLITERNKLMIILEQST